MGSAARSVFAWIYVTQNTTRQPIYVYGTSSGDQAVALNVYQGFLSFSTYNHGGNSLLAVSTNAWHFVGFTYAGGTYTSGSMTFYVDGQSSTTWDTPATPNTVVGGVNQIGRWGGVWNYLSGSISNIQLYNTSLSSSQVQALYQEGIGGAPIAPSNIVGWWSLNGDTKDYSGNNNNGAPTAITYVSQYGK
jgi:hypothetical protein